MKLEKMLVLVGVIYFSFFSHQVLAQNKEEILKMEGKDSPNNQSVASTSIPAGDFRVLIHELKDSEGEEDLIASGFTSEEEAVEYAKRRTWSSVEEQKGENSSPEAVKKSWFAFGETSTVLGGKNYSAFSEVDFFISNRPKPQDIDYTEIEKRLGKGFKIKSFNK